MSEATTEGRESKSKRSLGVKIFSFFINKLWLLLAAIIIFSAVLHITLGFLFPRINHYKSDIVQWVEEEYSIDIEVGSISGDWSVHGPSLSLIDFRIKSDDGKLDILRVEHVSLYIDIVSSLKNRQLSTQEIVVSQADLSFYLSHDLGISILNVNDKASSIDIDETTQSLFDIIFAQNKISLENSSLKLYTSSGVEFKYQVKQIEMNNYGDIHQLTGELSYLDGGKIDLVSEIYGDPTNKDSYANVYLNGANINLASLPWPESLPLDKPSSGSLSWQFWGTRKDHHWHAADGEIELLDTGWVVDDTIANFNNSFSSMFTWKHRNDNQGFLSIYDLIFDIDESEIRIPSEIYAKFFRTEIDKPQWEIVSENFQINLLSNYLSNILSEENNFSQFLSTANPQVSLENVNIKMVKADHQWLFPSAYFSFSDVNYNKWNNLPVVTGLAGEIAIYEDKGFASFSSSAADFVFGELFRQPLNFNQFNTSLSWTLDEQKEFEIRVNRLSAINEDLKVESKGRYFFQQEQPILSLYAELSEVDASKKSEYLPTGIMESELVEYLDKGVKAGTLPLIKTITRGPLPKFPYQDTSGIFAALGILKNATYQYLPEWPEIEELNAKLLFEGNGMDISADRAISKNNQLLSARAITQDFSLDNPILELDFNATSTNNSGRQLLKESPLKDIYKVLTEIDYHGQVETDIEMDIGLNDESIKLNGNVDFISDTSNVTTSIIGLNNVTGSVKFSEKGILQSQLQAKFQGELLDVKLSGKDSSDSPELVIDVRGNILNTGITHFIGSEWTDFVTGKTEFSSLIQFSPQDKKSATRVLFQSSLKGIEIDLPNQLGKKKDEISEVFLTLELDDISTGEVNWKQASGKWYWFDSSSEIKKEIQTGNGERSSITYGGDFFINKKGMFSTSILPGIRIDADFESSSYSEWHPFISAVKQNYSKKLALPEESLNKNIVIDKVKLNIQRLDTPVTNLEQVNLEIRKPQNEPWDFILSSEQGKLALSVKQDEPWLLRARNLNIKLLEDLLVDDDRNNKTLFESSLSPNDIIDMDIECINCIFQEREYGNINANIKTVGEGTEFLGVINNEKKHDLIFSGNWLLDNEGKTNSSVKLQLKTNDVGKFLKRWEIDAAIADSSVLLAADLNWQGSPWDFDYKEFEGDFQLSLGKGYLTEITDESGRLFTLFNLQSILRKLTFDFKDVYKKGFFYDSINGTFQMRDGTLSTENVRIKGNVADVKLYGTTDVVNREVEQLAIITPHLTSSFPVLAAWAVEPTTGLIVFLLGKLMEPAVEVATQIDYRIHGGFDDIQVEEIKTSKKKVKVEYDSDNVPEEIDRLLPKEEKEQESIQEKASQSGENDLFVESELQVEEEKETKNEGQGKQDSKLELDVEPEPEPEPELEI